MFDSSHFHQLVKPLPRSLVQIAIDRHEADKYTKSFSCYNHLLVMIYGQLCGFNSLRTISVAFNGHCGHHYHLGVKAVKRSTLADANARRTPLVFSDMAAYLMSKCQRKLKKEGQELIQLLDSTSLTLKGRGYDAWTLGNKNRFTQGLKVHVLYDEAKQVPVKAHFTPPNVNDVTAALGLAFESGQTYVFDKGYYDYNWWYTIEKSQAKFVTRFKSDAALKVEAVNEIPSASEGLILEDSLVRFKHKRPRGGKVNEYEKVLRRVQVRRAGKEPLILATNDLESPAEKIAECYRRRWQIELFFKWIKQHLKIKAFLGRSENAVKIQILCAMIAYLLLSMYKTASRYDGSIWEFMALVGSCLFQRPSLEEHYRKRLEKTQKIRDQQPRLFT